MAAWGKALLEEHKHLFVVDQPYVWRRLGMILCPLWPSGPWRRKTVYRDGTPVYEYPRDDPFAPDLVMLLAGLGLPALLTAAVVRSRGLPLVDPFTVLAADVALLVVDVAALVGIRLIFKAFAPGALCLAAYGGSAFVSGAVFTLACAVLNPVGRWLLLLVLAGAMAGFMARIMWPVVRSERTRELGVEEDAALLVGPVAAAAVAQAVVVMWLASWQL